MAICQVCRIKEQSWMHELSCREHNPLVWFFVDFVRATNDETKKSAVKKYWETVNAVTN